MERFLSINVFILVILLIAMETKSAPNKITEYSTSQAANDIFRELLAVIANVNEQRLNALEIFTELDKKIPSNGVLRYIEERREDPLTAILLLNGVGDKAIIGVSYEINDPSKVAINYPLRDIPRISKKYYDDDFEINEEMNIKGLREYIEKLNEGEIGVIKNNIEGRPVTSYLKEKNKSNGDNGIFNDKFKLILGSKLDTKNILRSSCWRKATKKCKKACKAAFKELCREYKCSHSMKKSLKRNCKRECKDAFDG